MRLDVRPAVTLAALASAALAVAAAYEGPRTRARDVSRELGDGSQLRWVLVGLGIIYSVRGELRASLAQGQELMRLASGTDDPLLTAEACWFAGINLAGLGDFSGARQPLEAGIRAYDPSREQLEGLTPIGPGVCCRCGQAYILWPLGFADQALMCVNEVVAMSRELRHPEATAFALFFAALVHQLRREPEQTLESAAAAVEISTEHGLANTLAWSDVMRGWVLAADGAVDEGTALMCESLRTQRAMGCETLRPYFLGLLAHALGGAGRVEAALDALAEAFSCAERTEERYYEAELYRLKGELLLVQAAQDTESPGWRQDGGAVTEAEACFHQAMDIARRQQARSWELRATTSLCRLYLKQGRRPEAREMLARIYGWFTEGFDTADVKDAKALLEELSTD